MPSFCGRVWLVAILSASTRRVHIPVLKPPRDPQVFPSSGFAWDPSGTKDANRGSCFLSVGRFRVLVMPVCWGCHLNVFFVCVPDPCNIPMISSAFTSSR